MSAFRARPPLVVSALAVALAACSSGPARSPDDGVPDARPLTMELNVKASEDAPAVRPDDQSKSRPLVYVNGDVVTYRDVLLRVGSLTKVVGTDQEREMEERRALVDIVRDRVLDRAARDAGVEVTRDEIDSERARRVRQIEKNGGTLDQFLAENGGLSRREFDDQVLRTIRAQRYLMAAIGVAASARVRVRPMTDIDPSPQEMRAFFDRNPAQFEVRESAKVRVMAFVPDRNAEDRDAAVAAAKQRAETALARLQAGEDFVPVYRELFHDEANPDATDGLYEMGERPSKYAPWIEEYAYTAPRGERKIHALPEGRGFYVLQAEGFTPARTRSYEEAQADVRDWLRNAKFQIGRYEVELSLLEDAAIAPRERYEDVRQYLAAQRKRVVTQTGL